MLRLFKKKKPEIVYKSKIIHKYYVVLMNGHSSDECISCTYITEPQIDEYYTDGLHVKHRIVLANKMSLKDLIKKHKKDGCFISDGGMAYPYSRLNRIFKLTYEEGDLVKFYISSDKNIIKED